MNALVQKLENAYLMLEHARNAQEIDALKVRIARLERDIIEAARDAYARSQDGEG